MIAVDDMRPELGSYGCSHMHTPHLDALAAESLSFDNAYIAVAWCSPSRTVRGGVGRQEYPSMRGTLLRSVGLSGKDGANMTSPTMPEAVVRTAPPTLHPACDPHRPPARAWLAHFSATNSIVCRC